MVQTPSCQNPSPLSGVTVRVSGRGNTDGATGTKPQTDPESTNRSWIRSAVSMCNSAQNHHNKVLHIMKTRAEGNRFCVGGQTQRYH